MHNNRYCTELRKFVAPEIIFGCGARNYVADYAINIGGNNVMVVSDQGVSMAGWCQQVMQSLTNSGLNCTIFSGITPNPRDTEVMNGVDTYRKNDCDAIVAVGGGSVIDAAKGIAIIANNGGHILDYEGVDTIPEPVAPLICLPTTSGTAADVSQFAIVNDTKRKTKIAIISKAIVPDVSLIDPEMSCTMDSYLTACTGMDVLTHAIESYVSNACSPLTDPHALRAMKLVKAYLEKAAKEPDNAEARYWMSMACLDAGLSFSNASLGAVHAMAHSLGGMLDLPHGECNAILLEIVIAFNFRCSIQRYTEIAKNLDIETDGLTDDEICSSLISTIRSLRTNLGINNTSCLEGLQHEQLQALAQKAAADACLVTNPRPASVNEIEELYAKLT